MPCRSYDDDYSPRPDPMVRENLDKLARIACKALTELEKYEDGGLETLILKDPEVAEWWANHKEADRKAQAEEAAKRKKAAEKAALTRKKNDSYSWTEERKEQQRNRLAINPAPPRSFTEQHKEQLRNEKSAKVICPHCGKEGTMLIMPRWHFDNCKKRP